MGDQTFKKSLDIKKSNAVRSIFPNKIIVFIKQIKKKEGKTLPSARRWRAHRGWN